MYKIVFFVPTAEKEEVKQALFDCGVGTYSGYAECAWESKGVGQFRPLKGSTPFIGDEGSLELVEEFRVEMICEDLLIKKALQTLVDTHPYEEPAYEAWRIETLDTL